MHQKGVYTYPFPSSYLRALDALAVLDRYEY